MKKEFVLEAIHEFPSEIDLNELFERLMIKEKLAEGVTQIEKGQTISHEKVVARFNRKWRK